MEGVFVLSTIFRNWKVRPAPDATQELTHEPIDQLKAKA
jgi:hypothetical protein